MNIEYKNFIGIYRNVYAEGYCKHLIEQFECLVEMGAGSNRQQSENALNHHKNDMQINLNIGVHLENFFNNINSRNVFFEGLQKCYNNYVEKFSVLKGDVIHGTAMKLQRTDPGGGYHLWHSEQGNNLFAERVLVYMLYLNDLNEKDGGETEFLYQRLRLRPEANTMIIWPAAFTHTHRGNTVLGNQSKYIVTGWFYYE